MKSLHTHVPGHILMPVSGGERKPPGTGSVLAPGIAAHVPLQRRILSRVLVLILWALLSGAVSGHEGASHQEEGQQEAVQQEAIKLEDEKPGEATPGPVQSGIETRLRPGDSGLSYTGVKGLSGLGAEGLELGWMVLLIPDDSLGYAGDPATEEAGLDELPGGWTVLGGRGGTGPALTSAVELSFTPGRNSAGKGGSVFTAGLAAGMHRPGNLLLGIASPFSSSGGRPTASPLKKPAGWAYLSSDGQLHGIPLLWSGLQWGKTRDAQAGAQPIAQPSQHPIKQPIKQPLGPPAKQPVQRPVNGPMKKPHTRSIELDFQTAVSPALDLGIFSLIFRSESPHSRFYAAPAVLAARRKWMPGSNEEEQLSGTLFWRPGDILLINWALFTGCKAVRVPRNAGKSSSSVSEISEELELCLGMQQLKWTEACGVSSPASPWLRSRWDLDIFYPVGVEISLELEGSFNFRELMSLDAEGRSCRRILPFWKIRGITGLKMAEMVQLGSDLIWTGKPGEEALAELQSLTADVDTHAFSCGGKWENPGDPRTGSLDLYAGFALHRHWRIRCELGFTSAEDEVLYPGSFSAALSFPDSRSTPPFRLKLEAGVKHDSPGTPPSPFSMMLDGSVTGGWRVRHRDSDMNIELKLSLPSDLYADRLMYGFGLRENPKLRLSPRIDLCIKLDTVTSGKSE